jgi:hypothetical protein
MQIAHTLPYVTSTLKIKILHKIKNRTLESGECLEIARYATVLQGLMNPCSTTQGMQLQAATAPSPSQ